MDTFKPGLRFDRYDVRDIEHFTPIVHGRTSGIYIFEFENGHRYVGQTRNFANRLHQHLRDTSHHEAWGDIVTLKLLDAPPEQLIALEKQIIEAQNTSGYSLRNKVFNFGFEGDSVLDESIPVIDQEHWALGDEIYGLEPMREKSRRRVGRRPKIETSRHGQKPWLQGVMSGRTKVADAVYYDLGSAVARIIPDAVALESIYWTVSDYPSTVGGRMATLNAGTMEILFIPRRTFPMTLADNRVVETQLTRLNLEAGTLFGPGSLSEDPERLSELQAQTGIHLDSARYAIGEVDRIMLPTGYVHRVLAEPDILRGARQLCLKLMRQSQSSIFRRWHSPDVARRAYKTYLAYHDDV